MSTNTPPTLPSQTGQDPNQTAPDNASSVDLPPDPLLESGSFIAAATALNDLSRTEEMKDREASGTSNGAAAESEKTPAKTNQRRSGAAESTTTPDKPQRGRPPASSSTESASWLPAGWVVEERPRTSGATAGVIDKYYYDPTTCRRFRSKKEVLYFLEFGTKRGKRKKDDPENGVESRGSSGSDKQKKSGASAKAKAKAKAASAASFDYFDPPDKIEWVLTDETYDRWTAFMGTKELTDSVTHSWVLAFASSTANGFTST